MFRHLRAFSPDDEALRALAGSMGPYPPAPASAAAATPEPGENPDLPAGYTYLGQLVDHDITFDPASSLERRNDPDALRSYRTPRFDLDSLYGSGPADSPYLYDQDDPLKLLVGTNVDERFEPEDLPRNQQGRALVGDPRNDVHVIVSQLHLAFIHLHNAVVDRLRDSSVPAEELLGEAQRLTRWHYQWVVVEDYLRRLVGSEVLDRVLVEDQVTGGRRPALRFFRWKREPFIPVEFSAAAYRFGHSQIRARYQLNPELDPIHILLPASLVNPLEHLGGFRPLPKGWRIAWELFFEVDGSSPQLSRRIDTKMTGPLGQLPPFLDEHRRGLALLDLLRGKALGLPSGEAVAAAMGTSVPGDELGLGGRTPLWYYLLKEAEVLADGRRLGPTGAGIVAEVLVGLLAADPSSYLRAQPGWTPELPGAAPGRFTMVDLLRFAGVLSRT
jgi:Animal haem peroxidase